MKKHDPRQMSFDFDVEEIDYDFEEQVVVVTPEMVAAGRAAIQEFDAAVRARDFDSQRAAVEAFKVAAAGGRDQYLFKYAEALHKYMKASDDEVPLFGQAFERIISAAGIDVNVSVEGVGLLPTLHCRAVNDDPFISETGYLSLNFRDIYGVIGTTCVDPLAYAALLIEASATDQKTGVVRLLPLNPDWRKGSWIGQQRAAA